MWRLLTLQARQRLRGLLTQLIDDTRARDAAMNGTADGTANGTVNGTANGKHDVSIRSGCKPGSFLDLLIHATNKETGKPFTDMEVSIGCCAPCRNTSTRCVPHPAAWCGDRAADGPRITIGSPYHRLSARACLRASLHSCTETMMCAVVKRAT